MLTLSVRLLIAAVLLPSAPFAIVAQQPPELSVERGAVVRLQTYEAESYVVESSPNLLDWQPFRTIKGTGKSIALTAVGESPSFFRVLVEKYPQLQNLSLTQGGTALNPQFSPGRYAYSFRKEADSVTLELALGSDVLEARLNGSVVSGTAVTTQINEFATLQITLQGRNGLVTHYSLNPVPTNFPTVRMTNHFAPDPESVILLCPRLAENSWPIAMDNFGVPLWWKRIDSGLHLRAHDNGLLSYTEYTGMDENGGLLSKNVVLDQHFNELFEINPVGDFINDAHNIELTTRGTAYLLAYNWNTNTFESSSGLTNVYVKDNYLQEVRISDRQVLFEWSSWGNLAYGDSFYPNQADYAHVNWVTEDFDGDLLGSFRGVNQVLKIRKDDGAVIWRLGGKTSDFQFINDPRNGFGGQHAAHRLSNGNILIFDNRNYISTNRVVPADGPSRVVEYKLDEAAKTATLVWSYSREGAHSTSQGGAQRLDNGNTFITWGRGTPFYCTEVDPAGVVLQDFQVVDGAGRPYVGYHAYKLKRDSIAGLRNLPTPGPQ